MSTVLKRTFAGLLTGAIFGLGLAVSGLSDPDNVLQFLTISSNWSPALLFTMGAGVLVTFIGFRWVLQRGPVFEDQLHIPTKNKLDRRLLIGAAIFGVGWGLAGFCPGPALTSLSTGLAEPFIFIASMIVGSQVQKMVSGS